MIDKGKLRKRLDAMLELPSDWDGFGTEPLNPKVHTVAHNLFDLLSESLFGLKIFVGPIDAGSLYLEFDLNRKIIEMTIMEDGMIHYNEIIAGVEVGSGSFFLEKSHLDALLSG